MRLTMLRLFQLFLSALDRRDGCCCRIRVHALLHWLVNVAGSFERPGRATSVMTLSAIQI